MIPKALASLRTTKCSMNSKPRTLRIEAIYNNLNNKRLLCCIKRSLPLPCHCLQAMAGQKQALNEATYLI